MRSFYAIKDRWWIFFSRRCLVGFPWTWPARPAGNPAMVAARRLVRQQFGGDHQLPQRAVAQALTMLIWPFAVLIHLWRQRLLCGAEEMPARRMPGAIWAALRHNILPGEYYAYKLWRSECRGNIDNYLYSHETARLFKCLNLPLRSDPINDKLAFYEMCSAHGIPTPPVLAVVAPTGTEMEFQDGPPRFDIFIKPRSGLAGDGAERFRVRGDEFESERARRVNRQDLINYLLERARRERRTLLVQPNLSNHPDLQIGVGEALATVRLVTGNVDGQNVLPIFGFISFGKARRITAQQGNVVLIDPETGRLLPPYWNNHVDWRTSHPSEMLPDWNSAMGSAKLAHQLCPEIAFIGWDIVLTCLGPMLLEGNINWSADEYQAISGEPLGRTVFSTLLAKRLSEIGG